MAEPATVTPAEGINVIIEDEDHSVRHDPVTGNIEIEQPDGGVVVQFNPPGQDDDEDETDPEKHFENLAEQIEATELNVIADELIQAIEADDRSRAQSLSNRERGLDLLGIQLQAPRSDVADGASPVDGMSSVTNPLLLEACLKGWANAQAELLPAEGPAKIQDVGNETTQDDELAEALERDFNYYLTTGAPEYYPDTSHMLLWGTYFGGSGFKKIYRCPMRRRPVSDSVDMKDLIVSDTTKDFRACERITHQIPMRQSVMKRMKLAGVYIDSNVGVQPSPQPNAVDDKIGQIQGTQVTKERPEDQPYTVWESQCELNIKKFAPGKFKGKDIPLPYLVTLDKDARTVLALRRDWNPDDEECQRKRMYVKYPYVPGPGFYGTGMLNILGNASAAMTAAWREALDAGMFANFPAFLFAKLGGRQNSLDFKLAPGSGLGLETNGLPIGQVATKLPYGDVTTGLMALIDKITAQAKEVGGTADMPAAEGRADVPVGTILAQIEQATKVMAAAHKGMHTAQSEEIQLLADLFREHPEEFWRSNRVCPKNYWDEQKLLQALDTCTLIPKSDPNIPSHIHRIMKAVALIQLLEVPQFNGMLNAEGVLDRVLAAMREDPNGLKTAPSAAPPPPPDLKGEAALITAKAKEAEVPIKAEQTKLKAATALQDTTNKTNEISSKERIAGVDLKKEMVIHAHDAAKDHAAHGLAVRAQDHQETMDHLGHGLDVAGHQLDAATASHDAALGTHEALNPPEPSTKT